MKAGGREKSFGKILEQILREILRRVISLKRRIWLVCRSQNEGYGGIFQHLFYGFARIAPFGACGNCPFLRHFLFQTVYFPPVFPPLRKERRFFCCMKTPRTLFPWPPYHKLSCIEQMGSADISRLSAKPPRDRFREVRTRRGRGLAGWKRPGVSRWVRLPSVKSVRYGMIRPSHAAGVPEPRLFLSQAGRVSPSEKSQSGRNWGLILAFSIRAPCWKRLYPVFGVRGRD